MKRKLLLQCSHGRVKHRKTIKLVFSASSLITHDMSSSESWFGTSSSQQNVVSSRNDITREKNMFTCR